MRFNKFKKFIKIFIKKLAFIKSVCIFVSQLIYNTTKKLQIMNTVNVKQQNELNDILDSELFNELFDFETEKKEIEQAGWTYKELQNFGKQLAKKIK